MGTVPDLQPDRAGRLSPRNALGVIALFVGVVEVAFAYPVTTLQGGAQLSVIGFMVAFPVVVLAAFLFVLVRYPENLYAPTDYADPQSFVQLITRRDVPAKENLSSVSQSLGDLTGLLRSELKALSSAVEEVSEKLNVLPERDRAAVSHQIASLSRLVNNADTLSRASLAYQRELQLSHVLDTVSVVFFDPTSLKGGNDVETLTRAAVAAFEDCRKRGILGSIGSGSVEVEVRYEDYNCVFEYRLDQYGRLSLTQLEYKCVVS